ncbi:hypothetical protein [Terrabacter sp. BE26]|uniref:hypothetical protein n=1 Tax=Terrabacter sp. BE26 TaxID=2898152 RepID=UPI0035BE1FC5
MYLRFVLTATATAALVVGSATVGDAAVLSSTPVSSSHADDGTVYASVLVGSRLFVGGSFTSIDGTRRVRLAALDAATGRLDTSFRADVDGEVRSLASDGRTLFIGGKFTLVNGVARKNLAAVNASTGAVVGSFNPAPSGMVRGLAYSGGKVFFGGGFTKVGATAVNYLAAADAATGAVNRAFPSADAPVNVVKAVGANVWIGGDFTHIGSATRSRVAAVTTSGGVLGYQTTVGGPVDDLAVDSAGVFLAVGGGVATGNSLSKTTSTGVRVWQVFTDGDVQAVEVVGGTVYAGGHFGFLCGSPASGCTKSAKKSFVADAGGTTPNARAWATFNSPLGVWDLTAAGTNLYALGVFTTVNGKSAPRLARFRG